MSFSFALATAFLLDLVLGDPKWIPHPVRLIGRLVSFLDRKLNKGSNEHILKLKGSLCGLLVISLAFFSTFFIIRLADEISEYLAFFLYIILSYYTLSTRDLYDHGIRVYRRLKENDLEGAKRNLSMIVSRDVEHMDEAQIVRSTVESVSENTNDGVCAPLFYLLLGGPIMSMTYKAINTLDSMIGYKDEKYRYFGLFSARLDDIFNFLPARISAFFISLAALIYYRSLSPTLLSFKTFLEEGKNHLSPNSGYPEAAMAGALGIRISGPQFYGGRLCYKPFIGNDSREIKPDLIKEALHISLISAFLLLFGGLIFYGF